MSDDRTNRLCLVAGTWECEGCGARVEGAIPPAHRCPPPTVDHAAAVEAAFRALDGTLCSVCEGATNEEMQSNLAEDVIAYLAARNAAAEAGYASVLVSRETLEAFDDARFSALASSTLMVPVGNDSPMGRMLTLLARDLAPLLKGDKP